MKHPPTVSVIGYNSKRLTILCPLCGERVAHDKVGLAQHMEGEHNMLTTKGYRGDSSGLVDDRNGEPRSRRMFTCYCGATFRTQDALDAHLLSDAHPVLA